MTPAEKAIQQRLEQVGNRRLLQVVRMAARNEKSLLRAAVEEINKQVGISAEHPLIATHAFEACAHARGAGVAEILRKAHWQTNQQRPFRLAAERGHASAAVEIARAMTVIEPLVYYRSKEDIRLHPLVYAIGNNKPELLDILLEKSWAESHSLFDDAGQTTKEGLGHALVYALDTGLSDLAILDYAISKGANINQVTGWNLEKHTSLSLAARLLKFDLMEALMERGARADAHPDKPQVTPALEALLQHGTVFGALKGSATAQRFWPMVEKLAWASPRLIQSDAFQYQVAPYINRGFQGGGHFRDQWQELCSAVIAEQNHAFLQETVPSSVTPVSPRVRL